MSDYYLKLMERYGEQYRDEAEKKGKELFSIEEFCKYYYGEDTDPEKVQDEMRAKLEYKYYYHYPSIMTVKEYAEYLKYVSVWD